jgi:hypothetical protein
MGVRRLSSACVLLLGAALWTTPALGADAVGVTLNVGHALPGATVHVTVTPGCEASAVQLGLSGRSAADDETGTAGAEADAHATTSGAWEGDLRVPDGLAAPQGTAVTARVVCAGAGSEGSAPLDVDAFTTQRLARPDDTAVGATAFYAMTGGRGSCWKGWVLDADGVTWSLFTSGKPEGTPLDSKVNPSSDMSSNVSGSFVVPSGMALGTAALTVHCSQTVDRSARFDVLPRAAEPTGPYASSPSAGADEGTPDATADSRRTGSRITLGGGVPVVAPEELDARFPLPVLAPPVEPTATAAPTTAPSVVVATVPVAARGTWLGWWALLGLLAVPVLAAPWLARRRRRRAG